MSGEMILTLAELESIALDRVDKFTREYWTNGAGENSTVEENRIAFNRYRIRPRVLRNVENIDLSATVLGQRVSIPVGIAPSGWHKMAHPVGEAGTAAASKVVGTVMGVSMGTALGAPATAACTPEEIKAAGGESVKFFQLYMFKDRDEISNILRRVEKAGFEAIMLTVDTAIPGRRLSQLRNRANLPHTLRLISTGSQTEKFTLDAGLVWHSILPWLRKNTSMQVWLKGILTAEDARLAIQYGVDGIIVSNHGGRQLDGCLATIDALPEIVAAVQGSIPVHLDGGIRRGSDVFRALALGADFVWIGRPALWGLAYRAQEGIELVFDILREELATTMGLAGCSSIDQLNPSFLGRIQDGRFVALSDTRAAKQTAKL